MCQCGRESQLVYVFLVKIFKYQISDVKYTHQYVDDDS
jgi:hypothetical protein